MTTMMSFLEFACFLSYREGASVERNPFIIYSIVSCKFLILFLMTVISDIKTLVLFLIVIISCVFIVWMILHESRKKKKLLMAKYWPVTKGKISVSQVNSYTSYSKHSKTSTTTYFPKIQYRYTVDTTEYFVDDLHWGPVPNSHNREQIDVYVKKYPLDSNVSVYYNPAKPSESLVEFDNASKKASIAAFCIFMGLFGLLWLVPVLVLTIPRITEQLQFYDIMTQPIDFSVLRETDFIGFWFFLFENPVQIAKIIFADSSMLLIVAGIVFFLSAGVMLTFNSVKQRNKFVSIRNNKWAVADGVISVSEVSPSKEEYKYSYYRPIINYTYKISNTEYTGRKINWNKTIESQDRKEIENYIKKYPHGSRVAVYYNPEKPRESFVEVDKTVQVPPVYIPLIFFGVLAIALFVIFISSAVRKLNDHDRGNNGFYYLREKSALQGFRSTHGGEPFKRKMVTVIRADKTEKKGILNDKGYGDVEEVSPDPCKISGKKPGDLTMKHDMANVQYFHSGL